MKSKSYRGRGKTKQCGHMNGHVGSLNSKEDNPLQVREVSWHRLRQHTVGSAFEKPRFNGLYWDMCGHRRTFLARVRKLVDIGLLIGWKNNSTRLGRGVLCVVHETVKTTVNKACQRTRNLQDKSLQKPSVGSYGHSCLTRHAHYICYSKTNLTDDQVPCLCAAIGGWLDVNVKLTFASKVHAVCRPVYSERKSIRITVTIV